MTTKLSPTLKAATFMRANATSPVISGRVASPEGGAIYILDDGQRFLLTRDDCRSMSDPNWKLPK